MHALILAALVAASGPSADEVRRIARDIVSRGAIQRDLPGARPEPEPETPRPEPRPRPTPRGERTEPPPLPEETGTGVQTIAYVLVIILAGGVLALLIIWVVRDLQDRRRVAPIRVAGAPGTPEEAPANAPLGLADRLAAEGRFGEAMHALLEEIVRRVRPPPARSLTSREILPSIAPEPRAALGEIVRRVEVVHFGGVTAAEADWLRCAELARAVRAGMR